MRTRLLAVVLFFAILNAAGWMWLRAELGAEARARPPVRIARVEPEGDADGAARLSLIFGEAVAGAEAIGKPLEPAPFSVEPPVAGAWQFGAPDRLDFVLAAPLPPGRRFRVRPAAGLEATLGRALAGSRERIFETRALELLRCEVEAADRSDATIRLRFNQPVAPADLRAHLAIRAHGGRSKLRVTVLDREATAALDVRVPRPKTGSVDVSIDAGLAGAGGERTLGARVSRQVELAPVFALLRAEAATPDLSRDVAVRLHFSEPLSREGPPPHVALDPPVDPLRTRVSTSDLVLEGAFVPGAHYRASVGPDLLSAERHTLGAAATVAFEVPDREPEIQIPLSHGILTPGGNLAFDLRAVNIERISVAVTRVHANNLVAHLRGEHDAYTSRAITTTSIALPIARNEPATVALDLAPLTGRAPGVFRLDARAEGRRWSRDRALVTISDLGLTVKTARGGLVAWVTGLSSGRPVAGATVRALTLTNQAIATAVTGEDGVARLEVPPKHPDGPVYVVTAERGDDLAYLRPDERAWVLDDVDRSGRRQPATYDVCLYPERGAYRPGDAIHLSGIVRDAAGETPAAMPLEVRVTRPDGRLAARVPVACDPARQGLFHAEFTPSEAAPTGRWSFAATLPGADEALGETQALVEAFEPVRIAVEAAAADARIGPGGTPRAVVHARYLFDQPAAGLGVSIAGSWRRVAFESHRFPGFRFGRARETGGVPVEPLDDKLDGEGRATLGFPAPPQDPPGVWRGALAATVTEDGGRSVSQPFEVMADTAAAHVGLRLAGGEIAATGAPVTLEWVRATPDDTLAEVGAIEVAAVRVEEDVTLEEIRGRHVWRSVEREVPVWSEVVGVTATSTSTSSGTGTGTGTKGAVGSMEVVFPTPGRYRIEAKDRASGAVTVVEVWAAERDEGGQVAASGHPEKVELILDRAGYAPGETARLLVRSPFAGTLLLAVETDRVIETRVVEFAGREVGLEIPVAASLRGGAFIAASVVRAIDPAAPTWRPHRAAGLARLRVLESAHALPLEVEVPTGARPGEVVEVVVRSAAPADPARPPLVHLWAVDEGLLRAAATHVPDPLHHFHGPRAPGVETADLFADLLPDAQRPAGQLHTGGDRASAEAVRRSPISMRRRAPAVLWRAAEPLGADGTLRVALTMPEITGALRLMAVAVEGDRYASTERALVLARPLIVETSWPRAVAPGDRFSVPLKLYSTAGATLTADVRIAIDGPLETSARDGRVTVEVPARGPAIAWVEARALGLGPVSVHVVATAVATACPTFTADARAELVVRPAASIESRSRILSVAAGEPVSLDPIEGFLAGAARATLVVSGAPRVEMRPALAQVIDYPYGCVEQTSSKILAMLRAPELAAGEGPDEGTARAVRPLVEAGIARLRAMQTRSGGLGYWPGAEEPHLFGTAYATSVLLEAKRSGYVVDPGLLRDVATYLEGTLRGEGEGEDDEALGVSLRALICRDLAGLDRPPLGWLARLSEGDDGLPLEARAHLVAAWLAAGRRDQAAALVAPGKIDRYLDLTARGAQGGFFSHVREEALLLDALLDLDPAHPAIGPLARRVLAGRTDGHFASTIEGATALAALARYQVQSGPPGRFEGVIRVAGRAPVAFDATHPARLALGTAAGAVEIESAGSGRFSVVLTTEGVPRGATDGRATDQVLRVRRSWRGRDGEPLDPAKVKVGDLVFVEVTLAATGDRTVENVAIVDLLPGGLEVENPRLATSVPWVCPPDAQESDASDGEDASDRRPRTGHPDRVEFLDDRVILFATAETSTQVFRYTLRATTAGHFAAAPIEASSMYEASVRSRSGAGTLAIGRR